jgi:hypothetical protein
VTDEVARLNLNDVVVVLVVVVSAAVWSPLTGDPADAEGSIVLASDRFERKNN